MVQNPYSINYERAILHHHIPDEPYHVSSAAYDAAYLLKMYPMKIEHRTAPSNSPIYHLQDQGPRTHITTYRSTIPLQSIRQSTGKNRSIGVVRSPI